MTDKDMSDILSNRFVFYLLIFSAVSIPVYIFFLGIELTGGVVYALYGVFLFFFGAWCRGAYDELINEFFKRMEESD